MQARGIQHCQLLGRDTKTTQVLIARTSMDCELSPFCWWSDITLSPGWSLADLSGLIFFRYFRLPDHSHHYFADQNQYLFVHGILLSPDSADISGAHRRFGRYLPDRLDCSSTRRLFYAWEEHCRRRRVCIQSVSTPPGRLFCAGRDRKSPLAPLVVRYRGTVLHFLATSSLDLVRIEATPDLDGSHRCCVVWRQPDDLFRLQRLVLLLADIESVGVVGRRHCRQ